MATDQIDTPVVARRRYSDQISAFAALLVYLGSGIAGGIAGAFFSALAFSWPATLESMTDPLQSAVLWVVGAAGTLAGVVAGWFVAAVLLSAAPGKVRCPRYGTTNDQPARSCIACELSFA